MNDPLQSLRAHMQQYGITPPDEGVECDGELHRFPKKGKKNGWYVLHWFFLSPQWAC